MGWGKSNNAKVKKDSYGRPSYYLEAKRRDREDEEERMKKTTRELVNRLVVQESDIKMFE